MVWDFIGNGPQSHYDLEPWGIQYPFRDESVTNLSHSLPKLSFPKSSFNSRNHPNESRLTFQMKRKKTRNDSETHCWSSFQWIETNQRQERERVHRTESKRDVPRFHLSSSRESKGQRSIICTHDCRELETWETYCPLMSRFSVPVSCCGHGTQSAPLLILDNVMHDTDRKRWEVQCVVPDQHAGLIIWHQKLFY